MSRFSIFKGPIIFESSKLISTLLKSVFCRIRVPFKSSKVSVLEKKKEVYFSKEKPVERGRFVFWRTIIYVLILRLGGGTGFAIPCTAL